MRQNAAKRRGDEAGAFDDHRAGLDHFTESTKNPLDHRSRFFGGRWGIASQYGDECETAGGIGSKVCDPLLLMLDDAGRRIGSNDDDEDRADGRSTMVVTDVEHRRFDGFCS